MTQKPSKNSGDGDATTHFGFREVRAADKATMVRGVFDRVAERYDLMNDVMSAGVHRLWKDSLIDSVRPRGGERMLDVAGGTGDIAFRARAEAPGLDVTVCDINAEMLGVGARRAREKGYGDIDFVCGDAQTLPVADRSQDIYTIAFGIRNVTDIAAALRDAHRVLRPAGRFFCLEFSPKVLPGLQALYERYSFEVIPRMGEWITGDRSSYQYLVESIRKFPPVDAFEAMMQDAGFSRTGYRTMSGGVVALHYGWRV